MGNMFGHIFHISLRQVWKFLSNTIFRQYTFDLNISCLTGVLTQNSVISRSLQEIITFIKSFFLFIFSTGRWSSVGIGTRNGLDGSGLNPDEGKISNTPYNMFCNVKYKNYVIKKYTI
jgi:hypothetical protein